MYSLMMYCIDTCLINDHDVTGWHDQYVICTLSDVQLGQLHGFTTTHSTLMTVPGNAISKLN